MSSAVAAQPSWDASSSPPAVASSIGAPSRRRTSSREYLESGGGGGVNRGSSPWHLEDSLAKEAWVTSLWRKIDRDHSENVTREELDCAAFHEVIRGAVAPDRAEQHGSAARTELNMKDAIDFCMRKADQNSDRSLSFDEFRSLLLCLADKNTNRADLAFALFDLDNSGRIDANEFRGLCRFFLGRGAGQDEFILEWLRATRGNDPTIDVMQQVITRDQYTRWLQTTPNTAFAKYAPPKDTAAGGLLRKSSTERPRWNNRINTGPNPGHVNDALPIGRRAYFAPPQSMRQLKEFYESFSHTDAFKKHVRGMDAAAPKTVVVALQPKFLSSEGGTPMTLPSRHGPGGKMRDHKSGKVTPWEDNFVVPLRYRRRSSRPGDRPMALAATFSEPMESSPGFRSTCSPSVDMSMRSFSTGSLSFVGGSRGSALGSTRRPRDPDDPRDVTATRATTLEAMPW